jgi:hypothetical protein
LAFSQRAITAFRALSLRSWAESFLARAFPPFSPPNRPSSCAALFFFFTIAVYIEESQLLQTGLFFHFFALTYT